MVTVYSKPNCPQCESAKRFLSNMDVNYEIKDITRDPMAHSFLVGEGHRSVPQIYKGVNLLIEGGYPTLIKMNQNEVNEKLGEMNASTIEV